MNIKPTVRLCVALLGIGMGVTLLWSEEWRGITISQYGKSYAGVL